MTHPILNKPLALSRQLSASALTAAAQVKPIGSGDMMERAVAERIQDAIDAETAKMRDIFRDIGQSAIDAFNEDSNDAEASALKEALDACRVYCPELPPDGEDWAI